jgi:hypothetical protein
MTTHSMSRYFSSSAGSAILSSSRYSGNCHSPGRSFGNNSPTTLFVSVIDCFYAGIVNRCPRHHRPSRRMVSNKSSKEIHRDAQRCGLRQECLQGIARDAWNNRANQPLVEAEFHYGYGTSSLHKSANQRRGYGQQANNQHLQRPIQAPPGVPLFCIRLTACKPRYAGMEPRAGAELSS